MVRVVAVLWVQCVCSARSSRVVGAVCSARCSRAVGAVCSARCSRVVGAVCVVLVVAVLWVQCVALVVAVHGYVVKLSGAANIIILPLDAKHYLSLTLLSLPSLSADSMSLCLQTREIQKDSR